MKLHILRLTNRDDLNEDPQYYTIKGLRERVLLDWYDMWGQYHNKYWEGEQDYTKEDIASSDEHLFDYMDSWGYDIETIYTITENDLQYANI